MLHCQVISERITKNMRRNHIKFMEKTAAVVSVLVVVVVVVSVVGKTNLITMTIL